MRDLLHRGFAQNLFSDSVPVHKGRRSQAPPHGSPHCSTKIDYTCCKMVPTNSTTHSCIRIYTSLTNCYQFQVKPSGALYSILHSRTPFPGMCTHSFPSCTAIQLTPLLHQHPLLTHQVLPQCSACQSLHSNPLLVCPPANSTRQSSLYPLI